MALKGFLNSSDINTIKLDKNNTKIRYASPEAGKDVECVISNINSESNNTFTIEGEGAENYELDTSYMPKIISNIHKRPLVAKLYNVVKEYDGTDSVPSQFVCWELLPTDSSESGIVEGTSESAQDGGFAKLIGIQVINGGTGYRNGDTFAITLNPKRYQQHYQHETNPEQINFLTFKASISKYDYPKIRSVVFSSSSNDPVFTLQNMQSSEDSSYVHIRVVDPCCRVKTTRPHHSSSVDNYNMYESSECIYDSGYAIMPLFNRGSSDLYSNTNNIDPGGAVFELTFKLEPNKYSKDIPSRIASDRGLVNIEFQSIDKDITFPDKNVTPVLTPLVIKMPQLTGYQKENYQLVNCTGFGLILPKIIYTIVLTPLEKEYDGTCCLLSNVSTNDKLVEGDDIQFVPNSEIVYQKSPISTETTYPYPFPGYWSEDFERMIRTIELTGEDAKNYRIIRPEITIDNSLLKITPRPVYISNLKLVINAAIPSGYASQWEIVYELNNMLSQDDVKVELSPLKINQNVTIGVTYDSKQVWLPLRSIRSLELVYNHGEVIAIQFEDHLGVTYTVNYPETLSMFAKPLLENGLLFDNTKCLYELHLENDYIPIKLEVINA